MCSPRRQGLGLAAVKGSENNPPHFYFHVLSKRPEKIGTVETRSHPTPRGQNLRLHLPERQGLGAQGTDLCTLTATLVTIHQHPPPSSLQPFSSAPLDTSVKAALGKSKTSYTTAARRAPALRHPLPRSPRFAASRQPRRGGTFLFPPLPFPSFFPHFEGLPGREGSKDFSFPFLLAQPLQNKQPPAKKHSTA